MNIGKIRNCFYKVGITNIEVYISNEITNLPLIYKNSYEIFECHFHDFNLLMKIIVLKDSNKSIFNIREFAAHYGYLRENLKVQIVMGLDNLSNFHKEQLINAKIPFILFSTNNLYMPFLGMMLSGENISENKNFYSKPFTTIEQKIFLMIMYFPLKKTNCIEPTWLVKNSEISKPSIYRMLDKLNRDRIFVNNNLNTYKNWNLKLNKAELWEKYKHLLTSPVVERIYFNFKLIDKLKETYNIYLGGVTALSKYTNLADDNTKIYVASYKDFRKITNFVNSVTNLYINNNEESFLDNYCELQFWKYEPLTIRRSKEKKDNFMIVDPLSLYLGIEKEHDSRIDSELDYLLLQVINGETERFNEPI